MKKTLAISLAVIMVLSVALLGGSAAPAAADAHTIIQFNVLVGIPESFTGAQAPIRGIDGGGLPWMLSSATGILKSNGMLVLEVHGLVLASGALAGTNPVPEFKAIVSCLTTGGAIDNEITAAFPATTGSALSGGGNAHVETMLTLPQPCIAPIVFVTSPGGAWFAATGR